jgi:hypothetical protein
MISYLENTLHKKRAHGVAKGVGPEFKLQYYKNQNKQTKKKCGKRGTTIVTFKIL